MPCAQKLERQGHRTDPWSADRWYLYLWKEKGGLIWECGRSYGR